MTDNPTQAHGPTSPLMLRSDLAVFAAAMERKLKSKDSEDLAHMVLEKQCQRCAGHTACITVKPA